MTALRASAVSAPDPAVAFFSGFSGIAAPQQRMHATAYNYWSSIRGSRPFPSIRDFDPIEVNSLSANSILLDVPAEGGEAEIRYLGEALAGALEGRSLERLAEAPSPSILSCTVDNLRQLISTGLPLAIQGSFSDAAGTVRCWTTLLPFSSTDSHGDYVFGVITFEVEECEAGTDAELPVSLSGSIRFAPPQPVMTVRAEPAPLDGFGGASTLLSPVAAPEPEPQPPAEAAPEADFPFTAEEEAQEEGDVCAYEPAALPEAVHEFAPSTEPAVEVADDGLATQLAFARTKAEAAEQANLRSRAALYEAIGAAYDFALRAEADPDAFLALLEEADLTVQARAPMTPVVKLVFGADYDKARLTEFAAVLSWARRCGVPAGALAGRLQEEGGMKAIVEAERASRRSLGGEAERDPFSGARAAAALASLNIALPGDEEFVLLFARREAGGDLSVLRAVSDPQLLRRAARKIK